MIKDAVKHARLVSTALYYTVVLYHLLYLMNIFYLLTIIVLLPAGDQAIDKAKSDARHLPDQGVAPSREGCLAGQKSKGLGRDVRVVVVHGDQGHLRTESAEPT
jgi:hypothetical protein